MDKEKAYEKFLNTWGIENQSRMAIEEMSELIKELCKLERCKHDESKANKIIENIQEEIADVLVCVEQLQLHYGKEAIDNIKQQKIARTLNRLG